MKKLFSNKFLKEVSFIILFGIIINVFCIVLYSCTVYASSGDQYFPMNQNRNQHFGGTYNVIDNAFDFTNNYVLCIYRSSNFSQATDYYYAISYPKTFGVNIFGERYGNGYQFSFYRLGSFNISCKAFHIYWSDGTTPYLTVDNPVSFYDISNGWTSSSYSTDFDYISNFRVYTTNTSNRNIILNYTDDYEPEITIGNTVEPDYVDPIYPNGTNAPAEVPPSYTVNNYTWNTYNPPSIDNTNIESLLESEIHYVNY